MKEAGQDDWRRDRHATAAIDAALVRRLVAEQFPRYRELPVSPVPGGHDNRTFRVGDSLAARLPSASRYAPHLLTEFEWLPKLAAHLPLPMPQPVGLGTPGAGYPWHWTLNRWIPGVPAARANISDLRQFARRLAVFLAALHHVDATGGPAPGPHNFHRGGELSTYRAETERLLESCRNHIDHRAAQATWRAALESRWQGNPVWVHGDIAAGNLLVRDGQLHAVIDFGQLAAGDPACDLAIAWTLLDEDNRALFRATLGLDRRVWQRARGWALWKQLLVLDSVRSFRTGSARQVPEVQQVIREITSPAI